MNGGSTTNSRHSPKSARCLFSALSVDNGSGSTEEFIKPLPHTQLIHGTGGTHYAPLADDEKVANK
jgi:hypothetical protein